MQIRRFFAIAALAALPKVAAAQFTTFIPPQTKVADSVKAVVAADEKARVDSTNVARITNMKVWVDSAAGVLPTPTTRADSLAAGLPTAVDSVTMPNGTRAPATASSLPLLAFAGLFAIVIGGVLIGVRRWRSGVRRIAGWSLVAAGAASLLTAGGRYALGAARADQAREIWEADQARAVVASAWTSANTRAHARLVDGAPVARLIVPRLGLDEIVLEGVGERQLDAAPGHVPGSALPGHKGNAIISAHRDRHFKRFDELALGDTIATESDRSRTTWVVVGRRIIDKDAPALFRERDATLTLTTCWPIRYLGTAPERLILTAKPVRGS